MVRIRILIVSALFSVMFGCSHDDTSRIEELEKDIDSLEQKLDSLKSRVSEIWLEHFLDDLTSLSIGPIYLDPSDPGSFQPIRTLSGFFFVSLVNVEEYMDGYKLRLRIGNLMYVTYNGFKLGIKYGPELPDTLTHELWAKELPQKTKTYPFDLKPGYWNNADLVISPVTADSMKFLELRIWTDRLSLFEPN